VLLAPLLRPTVSFAQQHTVPPSTHRLAPQAVHALLATELAEAERCI